MQHTLEIERSGQDEITRLLSGLGVDYQETETVRDFGVDAEIVRLAAVISPSVASIVGGAIWGFVRLRANQSVKIDGKEIRGMSADAVVKILSAARDS